MKERRAGGREEWREERKEGRKQKREKREHKERKKPTEEERKNKMKSLLYTELAEFNQLWSKLFSYNKVIC